MPRFSKWIKLCIFSFCSLWMIQSQAQTQPRITILDFAYQGPSEYYQSGELPAELPAANAAETKNSKKGSQPPAIILKPEDLQRIVVALKGILLSQGAYRLVPVLNTTAQNYTTINSVIKGIDKGSFPESDYVMYGLINYVNTITNTTSDIASKTKTSQLSMDVVGEFSLINTATKKTDVSFTVMGKGTDANSVNIASKLVAVNKMKVLTMTTSSLANAIASELEIQLTPTLIQQRMKDNELKSHAQHEVITIK